MLNSPALFTIGYSGYHQDQNRFVSDLKTCGIDVVADVRTSPYSRYAAEFNKDTLNDFLRKNGLLYMFMGAQLGARPSNNACYKNGAVDYDSILISSDFLKGLDRLQDGISKGYRIALMCAEKDPICCHRNILVAHALAKRGVRVGHFVQLVSDEPAVIENSDDTESRLLEECDMDQLIQGDLFMSDEDRIEAAYRARFKEIAYREENDNGKQ